MSDWNRSTSKIRLEEIQPVVWNAIQEHCETQNIQPDLNDYCMCLKTVSNKKKKKLFNWGLPKQTTQTLILTPTWLVVAAQGDQPDSLGVLSIQLKNANARDYKDDPAYQVIQDNGLYVTGLFTGRVGRHGNAQISTLLVLGTEAAAGEFKERLFQTIADAKKQQPAS